MPSRRDRAAERQRQTYAKSAATYDKETERFEKWMGASDFRSWVGSQARGETLEVGIGTGLNMPHYRVDVALTGVDTSPEMLALAKERAGRIGRTVSLMEADAMDLPFPDDSFDTVVCTYVLCSVPEDGLAVGEMRRVLKPGGRLILIDHVRSTFPPFYWMQWLYEFIPKRRTGEYQTRRPAEQVVAQEFDVEVQERLRAGILERVIAVKR